MESDKELQEEKTHQLAMDLLDGVRRGQVDLVKEALAAGANVNYQDIKGSTALHHCGINGLVGVAKVLLEAGVNINALDDEARSAVLIAADWGNDELCEYLVTQGCDIRIPSERGTLLNMVSRRECVLALKKILDLHHANKPFTEDEINSAFHDSVKGGDSEAARLLVNAGASLTSVDALSGFNVLHWAACHDNAEAIRFLSDLGVDVDCPTPSKWTTPLMAAAEEGSNAAIRALLALGANLELRNHKGHTAAEIADAHGRKETASLLRAFEAAKSVDGTVADIEQGCVNVKSL